MGTRNSEQAKLMQLLAGMAALLIIVPSFAQAQSDESDLGDQAPPVAEAPAHTAKPKPRFRHPNKHREAARHHTTSNKFASHTSAPVEAAPAKFAARSSSPVVDAPMAPTKFSARTAAPVQVEQPPVAPTKFVARTAAPVEQAPIAPAKFGARTAAPVEEAPVVEAPAAPSKFAARTAAPVVDQPPVAPAKFGARTAAPVVEAPAAPSKFAARTAAPVVDQPPVAPAKFGARTAAPVVEAPAAPSKFAARTAAPVAAQPVPQAPVAVEQAPQQTILPGTPNAPVWMPPQADQTAAPVADAPAAPAKFGARTAAPVEDQPPVAPAKFGARTAAPVEDQPPVAPTKFGARTAAPVADAPAPMDDAPAAPSKFGARTAAPVVMDDAPPVPGKFAAHRTAADVAPAQPVNELRANLTSQIAPASSCPQPITQPSTLAQADQLRHQLNRRLAANDQAGADALNWGGDDYIDAAQMAKLGQHERPHAPSVDDANEPAVVSKLLHFAQVEADRKTRVISGHTVTKVGSKRACLQGVRMAFQEAFSQSTKSGWTSNAKDAGPFVTKYGWKKAPVGKFTAFNAPVGSVLIYDVPGHPGQAGHIEIKGKDGYYSDFYSPTPIVDPSKAISKLRRLIGVYVPPTAG